MKKIFFIVVVLLLQTNLIAQHLFTNKNALDEMQTMYLQKKKLFADRIPDFFAAIDKITDPYEHEAVQFLVAYAPLSDLSNLDIDFFIAQAKYALQSKKIFSWGKDIPNETFIHFVLPYRINNEDPDSSRQVFQRELTDRIKNMSLYDAALEVNHWCHEKANYRASDGRTSGPLSTIRTGHGRCGEESTFTVAAMRSVGIPARQVYTPRWAHTDDNHAWVEVWVNGKWFFLGACEPSPELNMGWFEVPSTRTIMVHTNTFGQYFGPEKTLVKKNLYSKLNLLSNYAPTKNAKIKIVDENNNPLKDVSVDYGVYNYSEFYPFASLKTNEDGLCSVETGYGDLMIWATDGDKFAWTRLDAFQDDKDATVLTLSTNKINYSDIVDMTIIPPVAGKHIIPQSNKVELNEKRFAYEDSLRGAYEKTFPDSLSLVSKFANDKFVKEITYFVLQSRGNYNEIIEFYEKSKKLKKESLAVDILSQIAEKDLRDAPCEILLDHLNNIENFSCKNCSSQKMFVDYVVNPRIANELLRPWRSALSKSFSKAEIKTFRSNPANLCKWVSDNIVVDNELNYYGTPLFPDKVLTIKIADKKSRNIFFVACCRSLGIPARIESSTGTAQYFSTDWIAAFPEKAEPQQEKGFLVINNKTKISPKYYVHFTIAALNNGKFESLDYEYDETLLHFPCTLALNPGIYRMMTGDRQDDGSAHVRWSFFEIKQGTYTNQDITFNEKDIEIKEYFSIDGGSLEFTNCKNGEMQTFNNCKTDIATILAYIDPKSEPGRHFLAELQDACSQLNEWNGTILLVQPNFIAKNSYESSKYELPKNAIWLHDSKMLLENNLKKNLAASFELPAIMLVKNNNAVIFNANGYQINSVQMLLRLINRLQK